MSPVRTALLLAFLATPAVAQDAPPPPAERAPPPMTRDAAIARAVERFRRMDANGDGVVTKAEFDAWMSQRRGRLMVPADPKAPMPPQDGRSRPGRGDRMFATMDTDRDGKVTLAEAQAAAAAQFDRRDLNHDGTLSPDEMEAGRGGGWGGQPPR